MGCLHWTFEEVRNTDVNAIELALEGHQELLRSVFGGKDEKDEERPAQPMSAERFRAFAKRHNDTFWRRNRHG